MAEDKNILLVELSKEVPDDMELAIRYYTILAAIDGANLQQREIQLVAFSALRGNIYSPPILNEFIEKYKTSKGTVYNLAGRLQKIGLFQKIGNKMKVHPRFATSFKDKVMIKVNLNKIQGANS